MKVMVKLVEVDTKIQNQTGGSYAGTLITYTVGGQTYTKGIASKFLDDPRQGDLKNKLVVLSDAVPKEMVFQMVSTESNGRKFTNLVDIFEVDSEEGQAHANTSTVQRVAGGNSTGGGAGTTAKSFTPAGQGAAHSSDRELIIARSVGIKSAAALLSGGDFSKIEEVADRLTEYVLNGSKKAE